MPAIEVTYYAPAIGDTVVPMGLSGVGSVDWDEQGITLTGPMQSSSATSVFGCLGLLITFPVAVALAGLLHLSTSTSGDLVVAVVLGGTTGFIVFGRKLFRSKEKTIRVAWTDVKKLGREGDCVTFVSKGKPKGQVWLRGGNIPEELEGVDRALATTNAPTAFYEQLLQAGRAGGAAMQ